MVKIKVFSLYTQQIFIWKMHVWGQLINDVVLCLELKSVPITSLKK